MDPINPLDRLTAILRKRVAENTGLKDKAASGQTTNSQHVAAQRNVSPEALRKRIEIAVEALDRKDPEHNKKAARIFVENVMAWQFGDSLLSDSRFVALIEEVQEALEQDSDFHENLMAALQKPSKT